MEIEGDATIERHHESWRYPIAIPMAFQATALGDAYLPAVILGGLLYGDQNPFEVNADRHALGGCK